MEAPLAICLTHVPLVGMVARKRGPEVGDEVAVAHPERAQ